MYEDQEEDNHQKIRPILSRHDLSWFIPFMIIGLTLLVSWSLAPAILLAARLHVNVWLCIAIGIILPVLLAIWTVLCWFPVVEFSMTQNQEIEDAFPWIAYATVLVWPITLFYWVAFIPITYKYVCIPPRQR